jgi:hypothetical protein
VLATKRERWSKLIAEQQASGQTVRPFCRERAITERSFYRWRKRLGQEHTVEFALLEPKPASVRVEAPLELMLSSGEHLLIYSGVDAETLRTVLDAVRA